MMILLYIALTAAVCFIAGFQASLANQDNPDITAEPCGLPNVRTPWINIILISFLCGAYSKFLGIQEGLPDRINYAYNFLYRYPDYYASLGTLLKSNTEPGYLLMNMIIRKFTQNPEWQFFWVALITSLINLYVVSRISRRYKIVVLLTMLSMFFFQSTYLLRQAMAVAFFNLAFLMYLEGKKLKYILFSIMAALFHVTAVIALPIYYIFRYAKSNKIYLPVFVGFAFLFALFGPVFTTVVVRVPLIGQYIGVEELKYVIGHGSLSSVLKGFPFYIITLFSLLNRKALAQKLKYANILIISSAIYSMCWILNYNMYWFFRFGWFLMLPTLILVPELFCLIRDSKERLFIGSIFWLSLIMVTYRQIAIMIY